MKFCQYCGKELRDEAVLCPTCGCTTGKNHPSENDDRAGCALPFLSFLFPIVGLILWAVWRRDFPNKSKTCGKAALVSWILSIIAAVIIFVIYFYALSYVLPEYLDYWYRYL